MLESFFPYILSIHITIAIGIVLLLLAADTIGLAWIRGRRTLLESHTLARIHRLMWVGLSGMICTGLLLFYPFKTFLLTEPAFLIKMGFVAALIVNGLVIGRLQHIATQKSFSETTPSERMKIYVSGCVSTIGWVGALIAATMINL